MSGVGTAIAIGAGVSAAGAIGGAAISSHAAGEAAGVQADAAKSAAQLQKEEADNALAFQKDQWSTDQQNLAPWLSAGKTGLGELETELGLGGNTNAPGYGSLTTPFTAPTLDQAKQEPGYQFALGQGEEALQNSAAAKGNLVSGNTLESLDKYAQNLGETNYSNVYNRAFNTFETNQTNRYNRLAGISGVGQQAATTLGQEGQAAANNVGNISLTTGAQQGQDIQNAAAATASGYVGGANAWAGGLSGASGSLMNMYLFNKMFGGSSAPTSGMV